MQPDTDLAALEHRLAAAFDRIGRGLDRLTERPVADPADAGLAAALEVERDANAQLSERLQRVKARGAEERVALQARAGELARQLDVQATELQRLKKTAAQLRDTLRLQTDAMVAGTSEPHLINRAMLTELEALRAIRLAEAAEVEAVMAELARLTTPVASEEGADA